MTGRRGLIHRWMPVGLRVLLGVLLLLTIVNVARALSAPDFSGQWKRDNDHCRPKRSGEVTLRIEQNGPELNVETLSSHGSENSRHAVQKYATDGKVSVSTGTDGDEFHTSVVWKDSSLIFTIEENEEGRILHSREIWSLLDDGATLQRIRERTGGEKQILVFRRQR